MTFLNMVFWLCFLARLSWEIASAIVWMGKVSRANGFAPPWSSEKLAAISKWIAFELKFLYWPTGIFSWAVLIATNRQEPLVFLPVGLDIFFSALFWRWFKDQDDDRWKRRRKKLAEKVSVVGGKLAVTPA